MASVNLLALSISPPTSYPEERFLAGYGSISRSCDLDYPIKKQALSRFKFVRNLKNWVEFTVTCFLYQPQTICFRACDKSQYNVARFKINKQLYKWILSFYSMYNLTRQLQGTWMVRLPHSNIQSCAVEVVLTFVFVNEHLTIRQYFHVLFVFSILHQY